MSSKINDICLICRKKNYAGYQSLGDLEYSWLQVVNILLIFVNHVRLLGYHLLDQKGLEALYPTNYHGFNTDSNFLISKLYTLVYYFRINILNFLVQKIFTFGCWMCRHATYFKKSFRKRLKTLHAMESKIMPRVVQ